jgi:hypothetical protein
MNILSNTLINTKNIKGLNVHNSNALLNNNRNQQQQQSQQIDTNVDNYSVGDILTIFNLVDVEPTLFQIKDVANNLIARMKTEGKMEMAVFFEKAKQKVISEIERENDTDSDSDSDSDTDVEIYNKKHNNINTSSSLIGENWWEQDAPMKCQNVRQPPLINVSNSNCISINGGTSNNVNNNNNNNSISISSSNKANIQMIEYEKNIILEKLKITELKLRETEKENKKLRKRIEILTDR